MIASDSPPVVFLMGPTAAGKTDVALALHDSLPVSIVSVDSSQVYRGMDVGTAKPTPAELARAPHRLIDIRDPVESYSAAAFRTDALREIQAIHQAGRVPLLVGGTMFYFRALEYGLSHLPSADPAVRQRLADDARTRGWPALHAELAAVDPQTAARIGRNDAQRIQRALEIVALTGQSPSQLQAGRPPVLPYRIVKIGLWPDDRGDLHRRIAERFSTMLERGLIEEVEGLYRRGDLNTALPSMRTVGYRQVWNHLTGATDYNEMIAQAVAATRQLAKRQLTWLRHYPEVYKFDCTGGSPAKAVCEKVAQAI